jgi:uncharacterized membrane protein YgaE (UPF0421/DUF939 family)
LSEIVNTFIKQIAIPDYKYSAGIPDAKNLVFKKDYRPTDHYKKSFERMMDDILTFKASLLFIDDAKIANDNVLLNKNNGIFDYNDYLYYQICKELNQKQRVIIVTNDSDFQINDIEIVTMNRTLLAL